MPIGNSGHLKHSRSNQEGTMPEYIERCRARVTRYIETVERYALVDLAANRIESLNNNLGSLAGLIEGLGALGLAAGDDNTLILAGELTALAQQAQSRILTEMRLYKYAKDFT